MKYNTYWDQYDRAMGLFFSWFFIVSFPFLGYLQFFGHAHVSFDVREHLQESMQHLPPQTMRARRSKLSLHPIPENQDLRLEHLQETSIIGKEQRIWNLYLSHLFHLYLIYISIEPPIYRWIYKYNTFEKPHISSISIWNHISSVELT